MKKIIMAVFVLLIISGNAHAQLWSGVLAPSRGINWANAGTPGATSGTLPDAGWTQCGSTITASGGDDTATINAALSACTANHYVLLAAGTFNTTGIAFPRNTTGHIELRGSGANSTFINYTGGVGCNGDVGAICISSSDGSYPGMASPNVVNWTGGYTQGATQITLSSVSGITPNLTLVMLGQCDTGYSGTNCASGSATDNNGYFICSTPYTSPGQGCDLAGGAGSPDGTPFITHTWQTETVQVTAINPGGCGATCVTISQPLTYPNWISTQSPTAVIIQPEPLDGVRDLTLNGLNSGTGVNDCIDVENAWEDFIYQVACIDANRRGFFQLDSSHAFIANNYIAQANCSALGECYGDGMGIRSNWGGDNLFQNNICQQWKVCYVAEGPAPGDVIGYNFFVNQLHAGSNDDYMWSSTYAHSDGSDLQLYEGNAADALQDDNIHGSHVNQTRFRNFLWGWESCANGQCGSFTAKSTQETAIVSSSTARYGANIGNVLGLPGFSSIYLNSTPFGSGQIYQLGGGNGGTTPPTPNDPLVISTGMRWDSWDAVTNGIVCDNTQVPTSAPTYPNPVPTLGCSGGALPASFYLASKPAWFGSIAWPPIGPDVSSGNIGQCSGTLNAAGKFNGLPGTASSQCAGSGIGTAWGGHVNANPAMNCAINIMGMPLDGTGPPLTFNPSACYPTGGSGTPIFSSSSTCSNTPNCNYGTLPIGTPSAQTLTISNTGTGNLIITLPYSVTGTNAADFAITNNNCASVYGGIVSPSTSCIIGITFTPSIIGPETSSLILTHNAAGSPVTIALTGTGGGGSSVALSATALAFGPIAPSGVTATQTITLTNTGSSGLVISSVVSSNTSAFPIVSNTCSGTIASMAMCTTIIQFLAPASTIGGLSSANLTYTTNATPSTNTVTLSGNSVVSPPGPPPAPVLQ